MHRVVVHTIKRCAGKQCLWSLKALELQTAVRRLPRRPAHVLMCPPAQVLTCSRAHVPACLARGAEFPPHSAVAAHRISRECTSAPAAARTLKNPAPVPVFGVVDVGAAARWCQCSVWSMWLPHAAARSASFNVRCGRCWCWGPRGTAPPAAQSGEGAAEWAASIGRAVDQVGQSS